MSIRDAFKKPGTASKAPAGRIILDTPATRELAARWLQAKAEREAAESRETVAKTELLPMARKAWLEQNHDRLEPQSGILVPAQDLPTMAHVLFQSRWNPTGGVNLLPPTLQCERFAIRVDGDEIPAHVAKDFVSYVAKGCELFGVSFAFVEPKEESEAAVKLSARTVPIPTFNDVRHTQLSVEENERLEAAGLGTQVQFRVKKS